jgi:hypothetical protein
MRKEEVERLARRQHPMEAVDREDSLLSSSWMRRTGWTKVFLGTDRSLLVMLSKSPVVSGGSIDSGSDEGTKYERWKLTIVYTKETRSFPHSALYPQSNRATGQQGRDVRCKGRPAYI